MAHLQYMPGDPRLVDQLVYELKSKGIFDQFRKECISDVDTRPAYQNLRQRVENSVSTFLSRQCWKPDLNKNQLREKLRKHILDGNYLEQGVERIVDQVVNPKVASVFIPQVEDLVYNYLGITRKKAPETAEKPSVDDLLPVDLEAVSPGSVKSNDYDDKMEVDETDKSKDDEDKCQSKEDTKTDNVVKDEKSEDMVIETDSKIDNVPLPEEIKLENIPAPDNSPPKPETDQKDDLLKEVPLPEIPLPESSKESFFKSIANSEDSNSSSDSSLRRNMSPLTPIRNYNNENSCDAQQAFDNDSDGKNEEKKEPSSFRFAIESEKKAENKAENVEKTEKKEVEPELSYQFNQVNINAFNTPMYDDSSNSNNLRIDYESDTNSKVVETKQEIEEDKKDKKTDDRKSHKSSHRSRDSHRHSSSKDKGSESKHSSSRDSSRHDKKSSKDDHKKSSRDSRGRSKDRSDKKDNRDSSKYRSSSSHKSSSHRESKSHRSSSSSQKHSSKTSDPKKSSSRDKDKNSESKDKNSKDRDRKDSKSSSHRSDKDKKSSSSKKSDEKDKKKDKKDTDDHYSLSGRGNNGRRSTDRDSNDGSSSSKGSQNHTSKTSETKKDSKNSKSDNTSPSTDSTSPSDKVSHNDSKLTQFKPVVRVENLETPIANPPRLPFVPDVTLKKPKFAANFEEAKKMMKMRKFLDEEQKRMNQEAALLLEFQANVRPSLSQVYSSIPGPELEFVCGTNTLVANTNNCEGTIETKTDTFAVPHAITEKIHKSDVKRKKIDIEKQPLDEKDIEIQDNNVEIQENNTEIQENVRENDITEIKNDVTYDENKPFSLLVEEISEYSKASENKKEQVDNYDIEIQNTEGNEIHESATENREEKIDNIIQVDENVIDTNDSEIQIEKPTEIKDEKLIKNSEQRKTEKVQTTEYIDANDADIETQIRRFQITIIEEDIEEKIIKEKFEKTELKYFSNEEKLKAQTELEEFQKFIKQYKEQITSKLYLINCDSYEENIMKEVSRNFGDYEIINYYKNGRIKLPLLPTKNLVKDIPLADEVLLPIETVDYDERSSMFSPAKSECSFELSNDYDAKLNEIVNKKSRKEVLEIILGGVIDTDTSINIDFTENMKRKMDDDCLVNNNRSVLTPTKMRKLSESDQISSTTEDKDEMSNNNKMANITRSKYLGKAHRVGLPKPKRCNLVNSPSSDKSIENYIENTQSLSPQPPNGKLKATPRNKVQRYDTSDLYKPKLHYLSRRNNVT